MKDHHVLQIMLAALAAFWISTFFAVLWLAG